MSIPPPGATLHGVLMRVHGSGVLLTGASGIGKSELALELLARGHQLVADDAVDLRRRGDTVQACAPRLLRGFLEARSLGILNVRRIFGPRSIAGRCRLDLVLRLEAPHLVRDSGLERLSGRRGETVMLGITVPEITMPIRVGHNLAVLVEAACRDQQLRCGGYHADRDLGERQARAIRRQEQHERNPDPS